MRLLGQSDGARLGLESVAQVAILPPDFHVDLAAGKRCFCLPGRTPQKLGVRLQTRLVEIAQEDTNRRFRNAAFGDVRMKKAFALGCRFGRSFIFGQSIHKCGGGDDR